MNLTRIAVSRPITTLMASIIVVLIGGISLWRLAVDLLPDIENPSASVVTIYDGAGPREIETLVTRPIEQALSSVGGVERLWSRSTEGSGSVRIQFEWGTHLETAFADIREALQKIRQSLPDAIEDPYIVHYDVADSPIMYLAIGSELEPIELTRLTERSIIPQLERINGVARVSMRGAVRREIHVNLDRSKLEVLDMGVNEVVAALARQNVSRPAGDLSLNHLKLLVRSDGEFHSINEIAETVVREQNGAVVKIRDIADVVDSEEDRTEMTRINGSPGILLYVFRRSGANTIEVSDRVRAAIGEINGRLTQAQLALRVDKADFIRQSIANIRSSAMLGMGLAIIVLIIFLRSFRSTLIIAVSMPLSILATFSLLYLQSFTLNMVSFGGLALGIGLLVDNSIVVLESIFRKRDDGLSPREAAVEGTQEVASAITASTVTTLIVFLPLMFVEGVAGAMLHQLAWVVVCSLGVSLIASLTLTPALAAYWLKGERLETAERHRIGPFARAIRRLHRMNGALLEGLERSFGGLLRTCMQVPGLCLTGLITCLAASLGLLPLVGTDYFPQPDEGDFTISNEMEPGVPLQVLDEKTRMLEDVILKKTPHLLTTAAFIGDSADDGEDWHKSRFRVKVKPRSQRAESIGEIVRAVQNELPAVPGMKVRVRAANESMLFRMVSSRGNGDVEVEVLGHDLQTAEELAEAVADVMQNTPGFVNVEVLKADSRPELAVDIDRAKSSLMNVSVDDISQALETTIRGTEATVFREDGDEFNILVRLRESDRSAAGDVTRVGVTTPTGRVVPLRNLVEFRQGQAPVAIDRIDQQRQTRLIADVEGRDLGSAVTDLQQRLRGLPLPNDFTLRISGDWEEQQKSFQMLQFGMALALLLMYMVMASQFESLLDPMLIMLSVPFAGIGVLLIFAFTKTTLNVQSFIGLVMLSGIVVNNAIVLVDYYRHLRRLDPARNSQEIAVQAAVRRFRPILMTTLTTLFAMLPIAFGAGDGGELQAPMARVVVGGLASGTLTTLFAVPLLCHLFDRKIVSAGSGTE